MTFRDMSIAIAPGVRVEAWSFSAGRVCVLYQGMPEELIRAGLATAKMFPAPESVRGAHRDVDRHGRPFALRYLFRYRRGVPRALRAAQLSYSHMGLEAAIAFPGAREALELWERRREASAPTSDEWRRACKMRCAELIDWLASAVRSEIAGPESRLELQPAELDLLWQATATLMGTALRLIDEGRVADARGAIVAAPARLRLVVDNTPEVQP